jgi:hypothetical protein
LLTRGLDPGQETPSGVGEPAAARQYRYPITVTIHDADVDLAFLSYYLSWLSLSREDIAASQNYRIVRETTLALRAQCAAAEARFLVVYVPSKEHVYLPFVHEVESLTSIFEDVPTLALDGAGYLQFTRQPATAERAQQHLDDQARLLAAFAADQGIPFLDLTATFQAEAGAGKELYLPFDTHWNQQGHDLAAKAIAAYLDNFPAAASGLDPIASTTR